MYARAHDQTVADDYFTAMSSVERRMNLLGEGEPEPELVKAEERAELLALTEQLSVPQISTELRLEIARRMRRVLTGMLIVERMVEDNDHPPPASMGIG